MMDLQIHTVYRPSIVIATFGNTNSKGKLTFYSKINSMSVNKINSWVKSATAKSSHYNNASSSTVLLEIVKSFKNWTSVLLIVWRAISINSAQIELTDTTKIPLKKGNKLYFDFFQSLSPGGTLI